MFPRTIGTAFPFQQFAANPFLNPLAQTLGYGGVHPLAMAAQHPLINQLANPFGNPWGNPLASLLGNQFGSYGPQGVAQLGLGPFGAGQFGSPVPGLGGINPPNVFGSPYNIAFSGLSPFAGGGVPQINPLVAAQLATQGQHPGLQGGINPGINPIEAISHAATWQAHPLLQALAASSGVNPGVGSGIPTVGTQQVPMGGVSLPGFGNPFQSGFGNPFQSGFGNPFQSGFGNPFQSIDPSILQQLPIRPLVGGPQFTPQPGALAAGGGFGPTAGPQTGFFGSPFQGIEPQAALLQAHLISQLAASPYQQLMRAYSGGPLQTGGFGPTGPTAV